MILEKLDKLVGKLIIHIHLRRSDIKEDLFMDGIEDDTVSKPRCGSIGNDDHMQQWTLRDPDKMKDRE